jgi:Xaa-Pro aminopeptidase
MTKSFYKQENPWPQIRRKRIKTLLPEAMRLTDIDAWLIICRENANEPLAIHVGGENAGGTLAILFIYDNGEVTSIAFSPWGEAPGLADMEVHDKIISLDKPGVVYSAVASHLETINPKNIAINSSPKGIADGLSWSQRNEIENALSPKLRDRLVSSVDLVSEWLSVKLPEEVEIIRNAGEITVMLQKEAYATVIPGKTRDCDIAQYIKRRMEELGVEDGWAPDQNPNVNSGYPRGHAGSTTKIIQPGDFIQTDFGIKVFGVWCTDYQRFAYVLASGQTQPPAEDQLKWENAVSGHRKVLAAMRPGIRGFDVDQVQRNWMKETGSKPVRWSTGHPVGYWAHDVGPSIGGGQRSDPPSGDALRLLRKGQIFAYDGFYCWEDIPGDEDTKKFISVEEIAVVTEDGAEYLLPPQEELILIPSRVRNKT